MRGQISQMATSVLWIELSEEEHARAEAMSLSPHGHAARIFRVTCDRVRVATWWVSLD